MGSLGLAPSSVFETYWGNLRLTCCFCGIAGRLVVYCVVHALCQYQTNELLLWDRPDSCFLWCFTCLGQYQTNEVLLWDRPDSCLLNALSGCQANTGRCQGALGGNLCMVLYASGLFQSWVSTDSICISLHVLLACRPARRLRVCLGCYPQSASYQPTTFRQAAVGVRNRIACNAEVYQTNELLLCDRPDPCFLLCLHALGQYQTNELLLGIARIYVCSHWGHTRVRNCFCEIARIHVSYHLLRALR